jgi:hypothetical protein
MQVTGTIHVSRCEHVETLCYNSMRPYRYTRASSCVHNCSSVQLVHGSFSITCSLLCFHLQANGQSSTLSKGLRENTVSVNAALPLECSISFENEHNEAHTILQELYSLLTLACTSGSRLSFIAPASAVLVCSERNMHILSACSWLSAASIHRYNSIVLAFSAYVQSVLGLHIYGYGHK